MDGFTQTTLYMVELAEEHPTGLLVVVLGAACWLLWRQLNQTRHDRDVIMREMFRAQRRGHTLEDSSEVSQTMYRLDRRRETRRPPDDIERRR